MSWYLVTLVVFTLGLLSKPMLVTLPFVLLLLDYWPLGRFGPESAIGNAQPAQESPNCSVQSPKPAQPTRTLKIQAPTSAISRLLPLLIEKLPFFLLAAASSVITFVAQKHGGAVASLDAIPFSARLENALVAYGHYFLKAFGPVHLSPIYPHPTQWPGLLVAGSAALLLAVSSIAFAWRRRFPFLLTGWLWFLGTLIPVIGIVQVGNQAFADRYTYIPLVGIFLALGWLAEAITRHFRIPNLLAASVLAGWVGLLAWTTARELPLWKNTGSLFQRALALDRNNVQALYGLGAYYVDTGRLEDGKRRLLEAVHLKPAYAEALATLGNTLEGQGQYAEAVHFYESALKAQPDQAGVLNNLAWLRAACADPGFRDGPQAVRLATRACELTDWQKPLFIGTLAAAQAESGEFQRAITTAQRAASLAKSLRLEDIASRNNELIALYLQGKAAHGTPPQARAKTP